MIIRNLPRRILRATGPAALASAAFLSVAVPSHAALPVTPGLPSAVGMPSDDDDTLLSHIPEPLRATCKPEQSTGPDMAGAVTVVGCTPKDSSSPTKIAFALYRDAASMNAHFDSVLSESSREYPVGACAEGRPGQDTWTLGGIAVGKVICDESDDKALIEWTYDYGGVQIFGVAQDANLSIAQLVKWWLDAGPIPPSATSPRPDPDSPTARAA